MKNPKVRFSLDDNGKVFCYATSKQLQPDGMYAVENGTVYDMGVLAQLLRKEEHIDEAIVGRVPATGECHWVFEGEEVINETTNAGGGADAERLRQLEETNQRLSEENVQLRSSVDALLQSNEQEKKLIGEQTDELAKRAQEILDLRAKVKEFERRVMESGGTIEAGHDANGSPVNEPQTQNTEGGEKSS